MKSYKKADLLIDFSPWDEDKIASQNISLRMISYLTYMLNPFYMNPALTAAKR
jgi:hypothetical protein